MRRALGLVAGALVVACASLDGLSGGDDTELPSRDGGSDAPRADVSAPDGAVDDADAAPPVRPRCDRTKPFGDAHAVKELNIGTYDFGVSLTPDELTAYIGSNRDGQYRLYSSTRGNANDPFSDPVLVAGIDTSLGSIRSPSIRADGLELFYELLPQNAGGGEIRVATRPTTSSTFDMGTPVAPVNGGDLDTYPHLSPDGLELYFTRFPGPIGREDLFVASRATTKSPFGTVRAIAELNGPQAESSATITADGKELYFAASTMDSGNAPIRIHVARRGAPQDVFGGRAEVTELANTGIGESPQWIAPDGCVIYYLVFFGAQGTDIWTAKKPPAP